jgi:hypothetical protein
MESFMSLWVSTTWITIIYQIVRLPQSQLFKDNRVILLLQQLQLYKGITIIRLKFHPFKGSRALLVVVQVLPVLCNMFIQFLRRIQLSLMQKAAQLFPHKIHMVPELPLFPYSNLSQSRLSPRAFLNHLIPPNQSLRFHQVLVVLSLLLLVQRSLVLLVQPL